MHTLAPADGASSLTAYGDADLREFMAMVQGKLNEARAELKDVAITLNDLDPEGNSARGMMEANSEQMEREELGRTAQRLEKFIHQLEAAAMRIHTTRYGICSVTGRLIPKQRLLLVPHTTQCVEAKQAAYRKVA